MDELTQLKNRRGFFALAQQALKMARRRRYELVLFFMDLNCLKQINDSLGHLRGDQALRDAAAVLKQTFRASDILARIGGDEFVALAHVHASSEVATLRERLDDHLRRFNANTGRPYRLALSMGVTMADVAREESLESLLSRGLAARGQYGAHVQNSVQKSLPGKYPLSAAQKDIIDHIALMPSNPVANVRALVPKDPQVLSHHIKSAGYFLKADLVGTCQVPPSAY